MDDARDRSIILVGLAALLVTAVIADLGITNPLALALLAFACFVSAVVGVWLGVKHRKRCGRDG
jgi:uncharacterized membrane protein HdeD (DUF308 family)